MTDPTIAAWSRENDLLFQLRRLREENERLNEKIEFLSQTNMLYSDWEHRETQVTSDLIRKGIEEGKINAELRAEIERLKQRPWVDLTDGDWEWVADKKETSLDTFAHGAAWAADQLKEKNNG